MKLVRLFSFKLNDIIIRSDGSTAYHNIILSRLDKQQSLKMHSLVIAIIKEQI